MGAAFSSPPNYDTRRVIASNELDALFSQHDRDMDGKLDADDVAGALGATLQITPASSAYPALLQQAAVEHFGKVTVSEFKAIFYSYQRMLPTIYEPTVRQYCCAPRDASTAGERMRRSASAQFVVRSPSLEGLLGPKIDRSASPRFVRRASSEGLTGPRECVGPREPVVVSSHRRHRARARDARAVSVGAINGLIL